MRHENLKRVQIDDIKTDDVCMIFARIQVGLASGAVGLNEHGSQCWLCDQLKTLGLISLQMNCRSLLSSVHVSCSLLAKALQGH